MRRTVWLLLLATLPAQAGKTCVDCHAGAAERSWALSKHGVIARIEASRARRRTPDCAGCHTFEAKAPAPQHYPGKNSRQEAREQATAGCGACHSPRYVVEQLAAAQRGLAIGEMKRREAEALVELARKETSAAELAQIEALLATLRNENPARAAPWPGPPVARLPVVAGTGRARRQPAAHQGRAGRRTAQPNGRAVIVDHPST